MLKKSTITLLRIPFSYFLMPVFFFSLSQVSQINYTRAILAFVIIHFLMYPASNGYNSYMDRDEQSIGMIEKPPMPTKQLFVVTAVLDIMAIALSFFVNVVFTVCIVANILASRSYSYRGIRLKKYPVTGFLTVILFQGALTYFMVYVAASEQPGYAIPRQGMLISSLLFGGFYPLTQVYQHEQDRRDGVTTISYLLGVNGTFVFSGIMYALAEVVMYVYFSSTGQERIFWVLQPFFLPVILYFLFWWNQVRKDKRNANFRYSLKMNLVAATATNLAFILIFFLNRPSIE